MNENESSPIPEVVTTNSVASDSSVSLLIGSPNPAKQLTTAEKLAAQKKRSNSNLIGDVVSQTKISITRRKMMVLSSLTKFVVKTSKT